ncbi:glycoside-pentoside-hexuronide (GPH):cation symporter [Arenicella xantha]|uniref:GPH family glycoside/pentoside/hexuronide:cation symporter n=1 Tax=Arenicella xantha TaxID=644221 RepID=A0A395JLT5_9GAMM|nr:MFS transporter [Arenicella xantha]RBP51671.1 GPH family glycoside/pentoside/hexuronide:cation symporter [Arenicella xantha]
MTSLSFKEKVGYGLGDTASNIVFQVVLNFMMYFYTDIFGITAAAAGTLMLVVRLFDMVTDPIMGGIADRTNTRWGKYRPYLIWVAIPYGLCAVIAFSTPDLAQSGKLLYAYITYALLMTAYTAVNIPYGALGGVMTKDPLERGEIQGYRFSLAMVGSFIVNSSLLYLVDRLGGGNDQIGFTYAMAVLSVVALICFVMCFLATKERVVSVDDRSEKTFGEMVLGIITDIKTLLRANRQWAVVAAATFFLLLIAVMRGGATLYYTKYVLECGSGSVISLWLVAYDTCNAAQLGTAFLTIGTLGSIVGAIMTIVLARKVCKTWLFKMATIMMMASMLALYFVARDAVMLALFLNTVVGFFHIILISLVFAMTADCVDWGEFVTRKRATAMTFSGHLSALKLGAAIGGSLLGWILAGYGYQEPIDKIEQVQSPMTLDGIVLLMTLFPLACGVVVLFFAFRYRLTNAEMIRIQDELKARSE